MGRLALPVAMAAALVVTAVAVGAAGDVRIHRLHLPPPPVGDDLGAQPPAPPAPPGPQPPAPPAPPSPPAGVGCTTSSAATPDATGTLVDYSLSLTPTTFSSGATLTFRGVNSGLDFHTIAIRLPGAGGAKLCGTATITDGGSAAFTVTNLAPGGYVVYCTIHPTQMHEDITVG